MDITQALQQLIADYRQSYPDKWQDLMETIAHVPEEEQLQISMDVYILGFHIGGINVPLPDAMLEE